MQRLAFALFLVAFASATISSNYIFGCDLSANPGVTTSGVGTIACYQGQLGPTGENALACQGFFSGLTSAVWGAHLHVGTITPGGNPTFNFSTAATLWTNQGVVQNHWTAMSPYWIPQGGLTFDQQVSSCANGHCYFNVHTTTNNGGEVSCQLIPGTAAASNTWNYAFGPESAGGTFAGNGWINFTTGNTPTTTNQDVVVAWYGYVTGLTSNIVAMHVHDSTCSALSCSGNPFVYMDFTGFTGQSGYFTGVCIHGSSNHGTTTTTLSSTFTPGVWDDTTGIFAAQSVANFYAHLNNGWPYVNIHTATNRGGEARAQLCINNCGQNGVSALAPSALLLAACALLAFKSQ